MDRKTSQWLAWNVGLTTAIFVGTWLGVQTLTWLVSAFVWVMAASYCVVWMGSADNPARKDSGIPVLGAAFDAFNALSLAIHGWVVTAAVYLISAVVLFLIYRRSRRAS